jgi:hypothetical protein
MTSPLLQGRSPQSTASGRSCSKRASLQPQGAQALLARNEEQEFEAQRRRFADTTRLRQVARCGPRIQLAAHTRRPLLYISVPIWGKQGRSGRFLEAAGHSCCKFTGSPDGKANRGGRKDLKWAVGHPYEPSPLGVAAHRRSRQVSHRFRTVV